VSNSDLKNLRKKNKTDDSDESDSESESVTIKRQSKKLPKNGRTLKNMMALLP